MEQIDKLPFFNKVTLGVALNKSGQNLDYWIKTRLKSGEIVALKKGLFVSKMYLARIEESSGIYEKYIQFMANILRYPSYISLEYVLSLYGMIPEGVYVITSITTKSSRLFTNKLGNFRYQNIKKSLFLGYNEVDYKNNPVRLASRAKALFDTIYLRSFGNSSLEYELIEGLRLNLDDFIKDDIDEFKSYVDLSNSVKMRKTVKILKW
ncbi:MAG: hypothetical protein WC758_08530 [Candidatus Woesearchaeota archaeon]|jgi:predicted transcriptional regulator of viral defense system